MVSTTVHESLRLITGCYIYANISHFLFPQSQPTISELIPENNDIIHMSLTSLLL